MHVLGLPPAFALSQDQTLKLDENFFPADHVSHGDARAPPLTRSVTLMLAHQGVDLKRRPPKSRPDRAAGPKASPGRWRRSAGTPPSTFLFLPIHLSNSPEPREVPSSLHKKERAAEVPHIRRSRMLFTEWVSEGLRRHAIAQRRRAKKGDISFGSRECQPSNVKENCDGGSFPTRRRRYPQGRAKRHF